MQGKVKWLIVIVLLICVIVGGGTTAAIFQKNSLAHVYWEKLNRRQTTESQQASTTKRLRTRDVAKLTAYLKESGFVGDLAVMNAGQLVYQQTYDKNSQKIKRTKQTKYQISALQNAIIAAATMKLVQTGRLKLSTPVNQYYLLNDATDELTVGSLLTMTSGLANTTKPMHKLSNNVINWNLVNTTVGSPGNYSFQTVNYVLLAGIIAQVSGTSYQEYIKDSILQPAGAQYTGFIKSATVQKKLASPFIINNADGRAAHVDQAALFQAMNEQLGTKQLYTTAGDFAYLIHYLTSNKFLLEKYRQKGIFTSSKANYTGRLELENQQITGRATMTGYQSALAFTKSGNTGIVLLSNYQNNGDLQDMAKKLLKILKKPH